MPGRFPLTPAPTSSDYDFDNVSFCTNPFFGDSDNFVKATGFGSIQVAYSVKIDKKEQSGIKNLIDGLSYPFDTQNGVPIAVSLVTAQSIEATLGSGAGSPRVIPFAGRFTWPGGENTLSLAFRVDFGVTLNPNLFRFVTSSSDATLTVGLACFNLATLQCNDFPFTGQTYGQALPGYETAASAGANQEVTIRPPGIGYVDVVDTYAGRYDYIPPSPHRPWFNTYEHTLVNFGYYVSGAPIYDAKRSVTVTLIPVDSVKVALTRVSANRFRLYMDQQAVGGIMVLRYSPSFDLGANKFVGDFYGPTIVTIPANKREAFFNVMPGETWTALGYTVTLEACFGLPYELAAQFWPLEPDPNQFEASGP